MASSAAAARRHAEQAKELEVLAADLAARQQSLADREAALDVREVRSKLHAYGAHAWRTPLNAADSEGGGGACTGDRPCFYS